LYGDWLLPTGRNKPKQQQIVDELVTMISLGGLSTPARVGRRAKRDTLRR
jgi:hypothetical protein